ncbi:hypothetical protein [Nonomuraea rubra]|uniref:hypothetical protein n=1 Tax=Nonomuraea rubra TaxID=46180 RepID=UPI0031E86BD0
MSEQPLTLDSVLTDEAVLSTYRRMFAALARDSGAVVDDPALVDIAETLFAAFAEAGEEWLTHEQMRFACRAYPTDQFDNRLRVLKGLGAIREVFPKPNQLRYRASFTSVVGLMFIRRMMDDGGQSEMHRLLALEDLNVADPRTTMEEARQSALNLARAFRLWALELITLTTGTIEELREQAPKLWGTRGDRAAGAEPARHDPDPLAGARPGLHRPAGRHLRLQRRLAPRRGPPGRLGGHHAQPDAAADRDVAHIRADGAQGAAGGRARRVPLRRARALARSRRHRQGRRRGPAPGPRPAHSPRAPRCPTPGPESSLDTSPGAALERLTQMAESLLGESSRVALADVLGSRLGRGAAHAGRPDEPWTCGPSCPTGSPGPTG